MSNPIFKFFGIETDSILGIDIGSSAVKIMEISKTGAKYKVEKYGIQQIKPGTVVEKNIKHKTVVVEAIKKLIKELKPKTKLVCTSIPNAQAITKILPVSKSLTEKEIGSEIELEADRYIPYNIDDVNIDYEIIGDSQDSQEHVDVMLVASKKDQIYSRVDLLKEAGLEAKIIDIDGFATQRSFELVVNNLPAKNRNQMIALVDIGATLMTVTIYENGVPVYSREQAFGGHQLTNEIKNRYGLTYEESIMARKFGDLPDDYTTEVLQPFKSTIVQQISRIYQVFESSKESINLEYMYLTGGTSVIAGLDEMLSKKLKVKTFIANPFVDMAFAKDINKKQLNDEMPQLMNCCGLALRNVV